LRGCTCGMKGRPGRMEDHVNCQARQQQHAAGGLAGHHQEGKASCLH
jgi:hypothetical protein